MAFTNGTAALIYYTANDSLPTRDYSPIFYLADGSAYVYNTTLGWRTYEQAFADKTAADAAEAQAAVDKAAFDANFNRVYDADAGTYVDENGVTQTVVDDNFRTSRWFNTMVYSGSSSNDIYFDDALAANVVGVVHEDESHFDIFFDTGMLARIEYSGVVSPIFHFADGAAYAYNYAVKDFIPAQSGTKAASSADLAESADLAVSYDITQQQDGSWRDESGKIYEPVLEGKFRDKQGNIYDRKGNPIVEPDGGSGKLDIDSTAYEGLHEDFVVSRGADSFINKVTAEDDIHLPDAALANVTDIDITSDYNIVLTFDTGKTLRVVDKSIVSPVFHFADGSNVVYNWSANQWTGVTEATADVPENFPALVGVNNFICNAGDEDYVYFDTTSDHVAQIQTKPYYVVYTFDNGSSTAVRYTDASSPTFVFADGSVSRWLASETDDYSTIYDTSQSSRDYTTREDFFLSKELNNIVYDAGGEDTLHFVDAAYSDVAELTNPNGYTIDVMFNNGKFTTVEWWEYFSPLFKFADGTTLAYDYSAEILGNGYVATEGVAENITVSHGVNNVIHDTRPEDTVTFVDAALSNVTNYDVLDRNNLRLFFDNGTVSTIQFWDINSPTIQFADGGTLSYNYSTETWSNSSYATAQTYNGTATLSKMATNDVTAGAADTVFISDATADNIKNTYISMSSYSPYIQYTFNTGTTTTVNYNSDEGLTPNIVLSDGTSYQYVTYKPKYAQVDNIQVSKTNNSIVYYADDEDYVSVVDAAVSDITSFGDSYGRAELTFNTGKTLTVGMYDDVSPLFLFADGNTLVYSDTSKSWSAPTYAIANPDTFNLSSAATNVVIGADGNDTVYLLDAASTNLTDLNVYSYGSIGLTFENGGNTTISYTGNKTPAIVLSDGYIQYNVYDPTYETETFNLSRTEDNIVYNYAYPEDVVNFTDATLANVSNITFHDYSYVSFLFDTGAETAVSYLSYVRGVTPEFTFADGATYRYVNENAEDSVSAEKNVWQVKDAAGNWTTTSDFAAIPTTNANSSADLASSADLWGDVAPADDLFAGGSFVTDATLTDLVAPADIATSFEAADVFGTQSAGEFVIASAAIDSTQKSE